MADDQKEKREKLLRLMHDALEQDKALREQHHIGDKFRFIRDRLRALVTRIEESLTALEKATEKVVDVIAQDDMIVYVYLYNAQGILLRTWQNMLNPGAFYEYSVNRPIYVDKSEIEGFIRGKTNRTQHAYLAIAIKQSALIKDESKEGAQVKVKEGALHFHRRISFTHNGHDYEVKPSGELVKKE